MDQCSQASISSFRSLSICQPQGPKPNQIRYCADTGTDGFLVRTNERYRLDVDGAPPLDRLLCVQVDNTQEGGEFLAVADLQPSEVFDDPFATEQRTLHVNGASAQSTAEGYQPLDAIFGGVLSQSRMVPTFESGAFGFPSKVGTTVALLRHPE